MVGSESVQPGSNRAKWHADAVGNLRILAPAAVLAEVDFFDCKGEWSVADLHACYGQKGSYRPGDLTTVVIAPLLSNRDKSLTDLAVTRRMMGASWG